MLKIYNTPSNFEKFCEEQFLKEFKISKNYQELEIDYDVLILDKEKYTVDDIEEYINFFKYKSMNGDYKIAFINNFEKIDIKQQNKLLKIFEDNETLQIIVSSNISMILPTIISRSEKNFNNLEKFNFDKYPSRYENLLKGIIKTEKDYQNFLENENLYNKILEFYDKMLLENYDDAYIIYTTNLGEVETQKIYEILQSVELKKLRPKLENLLKLQERLISKTNKQLQIEYYLIELILSNK